MTAIADFPRIYTETPVPNVANEDDALARVCRAFQQATGWRLDHGATIPASSGAWSMTLPPSTAGACPSYLIMHQLGAVGERESPWVSEAHARALAESVGQLAGELAHTQRALQQREGELAATVPYAIELGLDNSQLAARLQAILRDGAAAIDCQAAALYLLDDATSQLKLRAQWGLSAQRYAAPPRPLSSALADLEALCGEGVMLESRTQARRWQAPEDFAASACVAVMSPSVPLGTLWFFSQRPRSFAAGKMQLIKVLAAHIGAELDRESLWRETRRGPRETGTTAPAHIADIQWQQRQLPAVVPLLEGWQLAACRQFHADAAGDLLHWYVPETGRLSLTLGQVAHAGPEAALSAAMLSGALRSEVLRDPPPDRLLAHLNQLLWMASSGDQRAAIFHAHLDTDTGLLRYAGAGPTESMAILVTSSAITPLAPCAAPLGESPDGQYPIVNQRIARGDILVLANVTRGGGDGRHAMPLPADPADLAATHAFRAEFPQELWQASAEQIAEHVARQGIPAYSRGSAISSVLVIKRLT